ncbi:MAG: hypothetical protein IJ876_05305 [Elusimicrobiaceae bacterium]|nr:hypothetical protein [Elusimicrobiaceae bacterium]
MTGIIIYSQSLQNDEKDDLWYNGSYHQGPFLDISWSKISEPIRKAKSFKRILKEDKNAQCRYFASVRYGFYFNVPCVEKDKDGRRSSLDIICPEKDKYQLEGVLCEFLQASNRSLSSDVWNVIKEGLHTSLFKKLTMGPIG